MQMPNEYVTKVTGPAQKRLQSHWRDKTWKNATQNSLKRLAEEFEWRKKLKKVEEEGEWNRERERKVRREGESKAEK